MSDHDFMRKLETSLQYWIERQLYQTYVNLMNMVHMGDIIAWGGGLAINEYLMGESRKHIASTNVLTRFRMYCKDTAACSRAAASLSKMFNSLRDEFGEGKPHSSWMMLCVSLARLGILKTTSTTVQELFKPSFLTLDGKDRWCLSLNIKKFGFHSDLAVIAFYPLDVPPSGPGTSSENLKRVQITKALNSNVTQPSSYTHLALVVPLSVVLTAEEHSHAVKMQVVSAILRGHVKFSASSLDNYRKAYDFALRAAAECLNKATQAHKTIPVYVKDLGVFPIDKVLAYKMASASNDEKAMVNALVDTSIGYAQDISLDIAFKGLQHKNPGRYADMLLQTKSFITSDEKVPNSKTGLSIRKLINLYTIDSKKLNVACLLAGFEKNANKKHQLLGGKFNNPIYHNFTFADFMDDMAKVFDLSMTHLPKPANGVPYKDLIVFRAVDLFEIPRQTVYNRSMPFYIVNHTLCSTSTRFHASSGFLNHTSSCCMLRITVRNSYTQMLAVKAVSGYPTEEEILFPRGSVFVITNRTYCIANGKNMVLLEGHVDFKPDLLKHTFESDVYDGPASAHASSSASATSRGGGGGDKKKNNIKIMVDTSVGVDAAVLKSQDPGKLSIDTKKTLLKMSGGPPQHPPHGRQKEKTTAP